MAGTMFPTKGGVKMAEPLTLYKLIILYMLKKVNFPLTNGQISDFVLEQGYTTYFTLQQAINELKDSELIRVEPVRNTSQYYLTEAGMETLEYFENKISKPIQADIDRYLKEHQFQLRNEVSVVADYYKTTEGEYAVECRVKERHSDLIHLTLTVPLKEQAVSICDHWKNKCQELYAYLMKELM